MSQDFSKQRWNGENRPSDRPQADAAHECRRHMPRVIDTRSAVSVVDVTVATSAGAFCARTVKLLAIKRRRLGVERRDEDAARSTWV